MMIEDHTSKVFLAIEPAQTEISVVVPVYMGSLCIGELAERLVESLSNITRNFEIILVDDRGPDNVWPLILELSQNDPRVKGLRLSRNFGQHTALTAGLDHAQGRWIVVMDCDLQDQPEEIPKLYEHATQNNFDIVIALRATQEIGFRKQISSVLFHKLLSWLGDIESRREVGNFRIFSRKVAHALSAYREKTRLLPGLMSRIGFEIGYVEISRPSRKHGKSSYTFRRLVSLAIETIIANSEKPLWLGIYLGLAMALVAFVLATWALSRKIFADVGLDGWTSLFIAITFFSGVQLMFAGIMGIYIGRVYNETKQRPLYLVTETSNMTQWHRAGH